jgi:hypothetical protein
MQQKYLKLTGKSNEAVAQTADPTAENPEV